MRRVAVHITIAAALVLAVTMRAGAATPPEVRVLGARAVSAERAESILRANGFPGDRAVRALQDEYFRSGRLFAAVSVQMEADSSFTVMVEEGPTARVRRVRVSGASHVAPAVVQRELGLDPGAPFDPSRLTRRIESLLSRYDADGYPFAQVWMDSVAVDPDSAAVDIGFYIVEGSPRDIASVVVEGVRKTKPALVAKISGIEPGTPYRSQVLEDAYLRLVSSGVFTDVGYPTVRMSSGGAGVDAVLRIDEPQRSHSFAAALGYAQS
ncbi:MAG TPA: POTRA domain-containing protein, partial [Candidatus Krumholzibacteria bacterium]